MVQNYRMQFWRLCLLSFLGLAVQPTWAAHAYALWESPRYPSGFAHFDYVHPQAPKGGELRLVANSFLKYPPLIEQHLGPCKTLIEADGFRIYSARRS